LIELQEYGITSYGTTNSAQTKLNPDYAVEKSTA
jgi:hypothetical protein